MTAVRNSKVSSRRYTKRIVGWVLVANNLAKFVGIWLAPDQAADILAVSIPGDVALIALYAGIGHLDFKTLVAQGLLDLRRGGRRET